MRNPCCDKKHNNGEWTKQEDQKLIDYIRTHGEGGWRTLPKHAGLHRCGKSCRLRWINFLHPDIKRGNFDQDEEDLIVKLHALLGNRWSLIAGRLPGRTDNEVKNYWNSHIRRKLINMGIDPQNHRLHQTHGMHLLCECDANRETKSGALGVKVSESKPLIMEEPKRKTDDEEPELSDAASRLDDEPSCSCELNLDLTIGFPSSSGCPSIFEREQERKQDMLLNKEDEGNHCHPNTLSLFNESP